MRRNNFNLAKSSFPGSFSAQLLKQTAENLQPQPAPCTYTGNPTPTIITQPGNKLPSGPTEGGLFCTWNFHVEKLPAVVGFQDMSLCRAVGSTFGFEKSGMGETKRRGYNNKEGIEVKARSAPVLQRGICVVARSCLCCLVSGAQLRQMGGIVIICCVNQSNSSKEP